jgi:hypothetical protein
LSLSTLNGITGSAVESFSSDIRCTLFKVAYRIAACRHHFAQQLIGFGYCISGTVNEPRLHLAPGLYEASTIARTERLDVETLHPICALIEPRLCMLPAIALLQSPVIFSIAKPSAQFFTTALSTKNHCGSDRDRNHNHNHATNDN